MNLAKKDAAKTFLVGPILDSSGAAKTDEVVGSIKTTKNGSVGAPHASSTLTHNHTGHYLYAANAGDFDTLGEVEFSLNSGTNAMAPVKFQVVPADLYDTLLVAQPAAAIKKFFDVASSELTTASKNQTGDSYAPITNATYGLSALAIKLLKYIQLLARKDAAISTDNANELAAINANGGSGAGAFSNLTDAVEALRDRGDAAWITATGFSTLTAQQVWEYATRTLSAFGFAVTLSSEAQAALVAAIEVELANDATGQALMQAIADKLAEEFDIEELTIAAIATAARDAILDRVLAGNHDTAGTPGKLLQNADTTITSRLASSGYTAPDNATISAINAAIAHATYGLAALKTLIDALPAAAKAALEADGSKLDHLWEMTEDDGGMRRLTENALEQSPAGGGAPTAAEIADAVLDEAVADHLTAGSLGKKINDLSAGTGAGAITWIYTITDEDTGLPIADVDVWITTDEAGSNVIASGRTNQSGVATFYLDAGTVYIWRQKSGYDFTNPDTEVVS